MEHIFGNFHHNNGKRFLYIIYSLREEFTPKRLEVFGIIFDE